MTKCVDVNTQNFYTVWEWTNPTTDIRFDVAKSLFPFMYGNM